MEAFENYDFEGDERWQAYAVNLTIPPGKESLLKKFKAKWYAREVDPAFDPSLVTIDSPAATNPTSTPSTTSMNGDAARQKESGKPPRPPKPNTSQPSRPTAQQQPPGRPLPVEISLCVGHLLLIATTITALQPFDKYLAYRSFGYACKLSVACHLTRLLLKFGRPSFFPMSAFQLYIQRAASSTEFFYLITGFMASSNPHLWLITIPMAVLAAYHASAFLRKVYSQTALWQKTGAPVHAWLAKNQREALRFIALLEISVLFYAALGIFSLGLKGILITYMYSNQLRLRFWMDDSRPYHIEVWTFLGSKIQPVVRFLPILGIALGAGQRWFNQPPGRVRAAAASS